jgi:hypothetical protein
MKGTIPRLAGAMALLLGSVSVVATSAPAAAQDTFEVSFDTFHDQLANYGDWVYSDRWGEVWVPADVPDDFRPYDTDGYWADTYEYGWYWQSNYEWGDIPFHYGRWVNDPDIGWLWIPGYVWSPAWVVWRSNGEYTGWMAMPPDEAFLGISGSFAFGGIGISLNFNDVRGEFGYSNWYGPGYGRDRFAANWVFIPTGHMADRDYHRYVAPRANYVTIINNTRNITNYTVVNNYVVNRSVNINMVQRAGGHPVMAVHASAVIKNPKFVERADTGRQIQLRQLKEMPHGNGGANSAPAPSTKVVQSLSTNMNLHRGNGQPPPHIYTRTTVESAPLLKKPGPEGGAMGSSGIPVQSNGASKTGPGGASYDYRRNNNGTMSGGASANGNNAAGNAQPNEISGPGHRHATSGEIEGGANGGNPNQGGNAIGGNGNGTMSGGASANGNGTSAEGNAQPSYAVAPKHGHGTNGEMGGGMNGGNSNQGGNAMGGNGNGTMSGGASANGNGTNAPGNAQPNYTTGPAHRHEASGEMGGGMNGANGGNPSQGGNAMGGGNAMNGGSQPANPPGPRGSGPGTGAINPSPAGSGTDRHGDHANPNGPNQSKERKKGDNPPPAPQ